MTSVRRSGDRPARGVVAAAVILAFDVFVSSPIFVAIVQTTFAVSLPLPGWFDILIAIAGIPIGAVATAIACTAKGRARSLAQAGGMVLLVPFFFVGWAGGALAEYSRLGWPLMGVLFASAIGFIVLLMRRAALAPRPRYGNASDATADRRLTRWIVGLGGGSAIVGGLGLAPLTLAIEQAHAYPHLLLPWLPITGAAVVAAAVSVFLQARRRTVRRASHVEDPESGTPG